MTRKKNFISIRKFFRIIFVIDGNNFINKWEEVAERIITNVGYSLLYIYTSKR